MATTTYGNTIAASANSLRNRATGWIDGFKAAAAKRKVYNQTYDELTALSNRDLADLGMSRSMIQGVAYEAAYGK